MNTGIYNALELLQGEIKSAFKLMDFAELESVNEIRLRIGRKLSLSVGNRDLYLKPDGHTNENPYEALKASASDIEFAFKTAFSYSLHSYSKELAMGYITTKGGNRVGICGTAVIAGNDRMNVETIKYVSSLNIRIARENPGFAKRLCDECFKDGLSGVLIIGVPSSGKTTLLRDTARIIGNRCKISVIDEQNELSATYRNTHGNDIGALSDVFVGYPKPVGISTAVRVMSPKAIIVDEIGTREDVKSLETALHSGVKIITAVHGESYESVKNKPAVKALTAERAFDYAVELTDNFGYRIIKID